MCKTAGHHYWLKTQKTSYIPTHLIKPEGCKRRLDPSQVERVGQGYALKGQPGVQVTSRAHKMSKSRGNVVNPDDIVFNYGADSLRLYEMFMGPLRESKVLSIDLSSHRSPRTAY